MVLGRYASDCKGGTMFGRLIKTFVGTMSFCWGVIIYAILILLIVRYVF